jgi:hypothetical protein
VGAAVPPAKRFVAGGSEPSARQAERSRKQGYGGGSPHLQCASLPLQYKPSAAESGGVWRLPHLPGALLLWVPSRLQRQALRSGKRGVGAAAPTCDYKILKVGYTAETIRESASARRLAARQRTAPQA